MHRFWAATFPNDYHDNQLPESWIDRYKNEIPYAMHFADSFLNELVRFIDSNPEYKLIIASSMGQEASKADLITTELMMDSPSKFMELLGINNENFELLPAMHPQYNFKLIGGKASEFDNALGKVNIGDKPLSFRKKDDGFFSIDLGHQNLHSNELRYKGINSKLDDAGLINKKIDDQSGGTAYHMPEGVLMVYGSGGKNDTNPRPTINTKSIAPSILKNFEIAQPEYMSEKLIPEIYT